MVEKELFIKAQLSLQEQIARHFNTTTRSVRSALHYHTDSDLAKAIRAYALSNGAKLYKEAENPYQQAKVL